MFKRWRVCFCIWDKLCCIFVFPLGYLIWMSFTRRSGCCSLMWMLMYPFLGFWYYWLKKLTLNKYLKTFVPCTLLTLSNAVPSLLLKRFLVSSFPDPGKPLSGWIWGRTVRDWLEMSAGNPIIESYSRK